MESSSTNNIAAAVYLMVEPEAYSRIFSGDGHPRFQSKEEAQNVLKANSSLTDNQRVALFSYFYLYSKLQKLEASTLAHAQKVLTIPNGVIANLEAVITQKRISYISKLYQDSQKSFTDIFINPEDFISKMIEDVAALQIKEEKKRLKGLKAADYEHEGDKKGMESVKDQKAFSSAVKLFNEFAGEKMETIRLTGSNFLVTEDNLPHVHNALKEVCRVLDLHKLPLLYIENGGINARTVGTKNPIICLYSGCLSLLTHDELLFLIGHEVGHIKSGHYLYHSMAEYLASGGELIGNFTLGLGDLLMIPFKSALFNWYRNSELSADRAGLLACQNPEAAFTFFTKVSGYPLKHYASINPRDILEQARKFEDLDSDTSNKIAKFISSFGASHPWTIMRAKKLDEWAESDRGYKAVLNRIAISNSSYADCGGSNTGISIKFN
jgi:Zn-dependent protease with chaperone function